VIKIRASLLAVIVFSLVAGIPLTMQAQETQTTQADTAQAPPEPVAIPAADVVVQAEATNERLRELRADAGVDPDIEALVERIPEVLAVRDGLVADSASQDPSGLTRRALLTLREQWTRYRTQLDEWQGTLVDRTQKLGADQDSLARIRGVWDATTEAVLDPEQEDYPEVAVQTIEAVRATIDEVSAAIRQRVDSVLTLQNQVVELSSEAAEILARIEAAEGEARLGLLKPEQPPLWSAIAAESDRLSLGYVLEGVRRDLDSIAQFIDNSAEDFVVQFAILLIFLILITVLGHRAKGKKTDEPEIEKTLGLFGRPFSATILILLLTMRLFHPNIPIALRDLNGLVAIIPLLRLLPLLLQPALLRPFYVFAALWLMHESIGLLPDGSVLQRLSLLAVASLALAAFVWFDRRERKKKPEEAVNDLALRLVRLGAVFLAVAIVAGILGYVDLASLLTQGTLGSILLASAVYAGAAVIRLLLWLLFRTRPAQSIASVRFNTNMLTRRTAAWVRVAAIASWGAGTLAAFDILRPTVDITLTVLTTPLSVGSISIALGDILAFFLAIWVATLAARFTRFILQQDVYPHLKLPRGVPGAITKLSTYFIIGLGLVVAVAAAGIDLSSIALLAGALGVGIGFGLQTIVSNFISGLILMFERPIQEGDTVQLDTLRGTVRNIGIRASTVRTFEGAEVLVPNADLIAGRVTNWTLSDRLRRLDILVGVAYGSDPHQVKEVLLETVRNNPDCLKSPEPYVLFQGFGDSSLDFELRFWTGNFDNWLTIKSDATFDVHDALKMAGVEIPFPQRDLHVKSIDASASEAVVHEVAKPRRLENPPRPTPEEPSDR